MKWTLAPLFALFIALPVLAGNPADPPPVERIVWHKAPIAITLPVGVERLVTFPGEARVGVPGTLQPLLRTQSVAGTVYWLAHEAFDAHRIQVQNLDSGEIYLIDLKAVEDKDSAAPPVEIVSKNGAGRTSEPLPADGENEPPVPLDYVALTRFAAQQLYAPSRLLRTPPGVYRVPLGRDPVPLVRGYPIEAVPWAAWRSGDLYVTAVRLRNLGPRTIPLDPRPTGQRAGAYSPAVSLRGEWLTAAFQHARLYPAGTESDTTAVYLISARPFEEIL